MPYGGLKMKTYVQLNGAMLYCLCIAVDYSYEIRNMILIKPSASGQGSCMRTIRLKAERGFEWKKRKKRSSTLR